MSYAETYGEGPARFLGVMQRYVTEYVNLHRPDLMGELMTEDFNLRYNDINWTGYATDYRTNVVQAMSFFPTIAITIHDVIFNGDCFAMRYTEHGRTNSGVGQPCAWGGLGLYWWNGEKLTANVTMQDLLALDEQLASGTTNAIEPPLCSPWDTPPAASSSEAERIVTDWLDSGALASTPNVRLDGEHAGQPRTRILEQKAIDIRSIFSAGDSVAFYAIQRGTLRHDFATSPKQVGTSCEVDVTGMVRVDNGQVASGSVIRNRKGLRSALEAT